MSTTIPIYFMGKKYLVPEGLTILKAIEHSGYKLVRGCGCRGGFCGACATVYRVPGDHEIKVGLACQTQIEAGMTLTILPSYPANKALYDVNNIEDPVATIREAYPEVFRCLGCSACTKICPQDIPVMDYIAAVQRGDLAKAAELSFDCIMCGLCASRCLAQMVPYNVAMLARRLYAKTELEKPDYVAKRIAEVKAGRYAAEIDQLIESDLEELQKTYACRDIEGI
jgi:succinate dehydrogenase/fumarate reductase-like Fe-S protein